MKRRREEKKKNKRREGEEIKVWICKEFWYEIVFMELL